VKFKELSDDGHKIILIAPSQFTKTYLQTKFSSPIREAVQKYFPNVVHVEYEVEIEKTETKTQSQSAIEFSVTDSDDQVEVISKTRFAKPKNLHNLNPKYTFENFITTNCNELATKVAKSIAAKPGQLYNPVFLYSGVGLGKTHLLQAVGHAVLEKYPSYQVRYSTCEQFFNLFLSSVQQRNNQSFKEYFRDVDVLLIDDIQFIAGKEATQEAFFHTFNELHQQNKQIILTSDKPPKSLGAIEERLTSRFEWGMVVDISKPELEDRLNVLDSKLKQLNLNLPQEYILRIGEAVNTNFRDLEGVLNRIQARLQLIPNKALETYELEKILANFSGSLPIKINIPSISPGPIEMIDYVCQITHVSKEELLGKSRQQNIAQARQIAMYGAKEFLHLSYPAIGGIFKRDHTTALHAWQKINAALGKDTWVTKIVDTLRVKMI
jgi:chromosomal replication initiator protein